MALCLARATAVPTWIPGSHSHGVHEPSPNIETLFGSHFKGDDPLSLMRRVVQAGNEILKGEKTAEKSHF